MRNRTVLTFSVLVASALLVACGSQSLSSTQGTSAPEGPDLSRVTFDDRTASTSVRVDAVDNAFKPEYVTIKAGTTVTFRNDGHNEHNVIPTISGGFAAIQANDFQPGTEQAVTFAEPGDYPYYCSLHGTKTKGMLGAIRVK